jgi:hypothetical protein
MRRSSGRLSAPQVSMPPAVRSPANIAPRVCANVTTMPRLRPAAVRLCQRTALQLRRVAGPVSRAVTRTRPAAAVTRVRTRVVTIREWRKRRREQEPRAPLFSGPSLGGFLSPSAGAPDEERRRQEQVRQERTVRREARTRTERAREPQARTRSPQRAPQAPPAGRIPPALPARIPPALPLSPSRALPARAPRALPAPRLVLPTRGRR